MLIMEYVNVLNSRKKVDFMNDRYDQNLNSESTSFDEKTKFYDITRPPFVIYGNSKESKNIFSRMPEEVSREVSEAVFDRSQRSAGIRVRFKTNSKKIAVKVAFKHALPAIVQSALAAMGFDIYVNGEYRESIRPIINENLCYEQERYIGEEETKDIILYFPYHAIIESFSLGLDYNAYVTEGNAYKNLPPIVFYGSSITHGYCASRPGNIFPSIVSRKTNMDYINLGFSGVCRGESSMADYLADLKKSVLVCEYDHNEADATSLRSNHLNFYKRLREKDKETPIIFISSPNKFYKGQCMLERMKVVESTCKYAHENGDDNVFFINGQLIYPDEIRYDCTADAVHPNDIGLYLIAEKICIALQQFLK